MDITEKIDDIIEGKKKKFKIKIDSDVMDQKKGIRIPTPPTGGAMKDKKKYTRKKKHKKGYEKDM
jgi:CRISPR/Cas system CSM-associated protein Csm4 (group 5 of RAMP superfamily)